jgi:RNA polymerase sigma factor, sigma-70 family
MNDCTDVLIKTYTDDFLGTVYYFCLKRTGGADEAESLASDISLAVISELRRGVTPDNFAAWVWRIARNRYAKWAAAKRKSAEITAGADINTLDLFDGSSIEDGVIGREDLNLMRRELAFISSDYRKILVAYYIDYRSVGDIAASLSLPVGTVKVRLFRSRNILKEGMNMSREFGSLSYKPENISFTMNGLCGDNGEPWSIVNRQICKNIIIAAYRTPSTAEELAMELGIALPYMEDELNNLVSATLLRKNGRKYETNIFVISADAQGKIYGRIREIAPALTEKVIEMNEYQAACFAENGTVWHEGYQPYEDMKWAMLMIRADELMQGTAFNIGIESPNVKRGERTGQPVRPNNGEWELTGFEEYRGDTPPFVGCHGSQDTPAGEADIKFRRYKFFYKNLAFKTPMYMSYREEQALLAVAKGEGTDINESVLESLVGHGYLKHEGGKYTPTFRVTFEDKIGSLTAEQDAKFNAIYNEAIEQLKDVYQFCRDTIYNEVPDFLKENTFSIDTACSNIFKIREVILEEALRTGYVACPDDESRLRVLGAYMTV